MTTVELIEITDEGKTNNSATHQFLNLPRIHEKISVKDQYGQTKIYEVLDVHHVYDSPEPKVVMYTTYVGSLENVIGRIARELV
ncbi:MAG: hypothetical protein CMB80_32740 [Flammeovirgaceae bacterium]|nr:hypothetical protein [Flammeovirgaceae bacterium]MBR08858.1 hypothetical protein [Rickettsiales bacterium]